MFEKHKTLADIKPPMRESEITMNANGERHWCVYSVSVLRLNLIVFIGCCKLDELLKLREPKEFKSWYEIVEKEDAIVVRIQSFAASESEAWQLTRVLVAEHSPYINMNAQRLPRKTKVRCLNDGMVFDTANAAAAHYGLHASNLSTHLNHPERLPRVGGKYNFERVIE
jgi:hypothetical protein